LFLFVFLCFSLRLIWLVKKSKEKEKDKGKEKEKDKEIEKEKLEETSPRLTCEDTQVHWKGYHDLIDSLISISNSREQVIPSVKVTNAEKIRTKKHSSTLFHGIYIFL
jgi:hypothetical protein